MQQQQRNHATNANLLQSMALLSRIKALSRSADGDADSISASVSSPSRQAETEQQRRRASVETSPLGARSRRLLLEERASSSQESSQATSSSTQASDSSIEQPPMSDDEISTSSQISIAASSNGSGSTSIQRKCCVKLKCFQRFSEAQISSMRRTVIRLNAREQREYLIQNCLDIDGQLVINGLRCCWRFVQNALKVSNKNLSKAKRELMQRQPGFTLDDALEAPGRNVAFRARISAVKQSVFEWLQVTASFAEKLPHKKKRVLSTTKRVTYQMYLRDTNQDEEQASFSYFCEVWLKNFPDLVVQKYSNFTKCDVCVEYLLKKQRRLSAALLKTVEADQAKHVAHVMAQRKVYWKNCAKGKNNPDDYLSIILDGADQSKYRLPHFIHKSKQDSGSKKLQLHLVGAMIHGRGTQLYLFHENWPKDSNMTIEVLQRTLSTMPVLPKHLLLQMDNCFRENKNRYVIAYLSLLVHRGVFQTVEMNFLPVGHTHEDIDQVFSRLSVFLKGHNLLCEEDLQQLTQSTTPNPTVVMAREVADFKSLIKPHLKPMTGHSRAHSFHISKSESTGEIELWSKLWMTSSVRLGRTSTLPFNPVSFPKDVPARDFLSATPPARPKLIAPTFIREYKVSIYHFNNMNTQAQNMNSSLSINAVHGAKADATDRGR